MGEINMIPGTVADSDSLLTMNLRVPQHVVYRSFPSETVVLNLNTGKYHGLNATAGRMLDELGRAASVRDAAAALADIYKQDAAVLERDLCELCQALLERGLIAADGPPEP
jgi:hypothetical protein